MYFLRMERKTITHITQGWNTSTASCKMVHRQSYLESLSTQVPDCWLQSFTEGLVDGESGSSSSAGERIPKTSLPHIAARLKQTQDSTTQLNNPQKYFIGTALSAGGGWRANRMRQLNNTTPQPTQQLVNFAAVTAGVSWKLVVRLKRLALHPLSLRPSSSVLLSVYRTMHGTTCQERAGTDVLFERALQALPGPLLGALRDAE